MDNSEKDKPQPNSHSTSATTSGATSPISLTPQQYELVRQQMYETGNPEQRRIADEYRANQTSSQNPPAPPAQPSPPSKASEYETANHLTPEEQMLISRSMWETGNPEQRRIAEEWHAARGIPFLTNPPPAEPDGETVLEPKAVERLVNQPSEQSISYSYQSPANSVSADRKSAWAFLRIGHASKDFPKVSKYLTEALHKERKINWRGIFWMVVWFSLGTCFGLTGRQNVNHTFSQCMILVYFSIAIWLRYVFLPANSRRK